MEVIKIPFNEFIGLELSENPEYLLCLDDKKQYLNHLKTVHASAQFTLAEATSGHFLLQEFAELEKVIPVVRKVEIKYRKPALGEIFSKAKFIGTNKKEILEALHERGRASLKVEVSLYDESDERVMQAVFEWFVTIG